MKKKLVFISRQARAGAYPVEDGVLPNEGNRVHNVGSRISCIEQRCDQSIDGDDASKEISLYIVGLERPEGGFSGRVIMAAETNASLPTQQTKPAYSKKNKVNMRLLPGDGAASAVAVWRRELLGREEGGRAEDGDAFASAWIDRIVYPKMKAAKVDVIFLALG